MRWTWILAGNLDSGILSNGHLARRWRGTKRASLEFRTCNDSLLVTVTKFRAEEERILLRDEDRGRLLPADEVV